MKREFIILLTSLMLIGLLGTASMSQEAGGTWTQKADMPTARYIAGSAVVNGKIYVIGGAPVKCGISTVVEEYDPATDTWTRRADMPTARQGVRAAAVDGIIYAIGGWKGDPFTCLGAILTTVEAYDPATDTWDRKASMRTARTSSAIAVVDGIIYIIGGSGENNEAISLVEAYDPAIDMWTRKADMPTARYLPAACVVGGRIYVFGGNTKWGDVMGIVPTVEVYDPATDTWTQASDIPLPRSHHSASVVDGKMYIIGGNHGHHLGFMVSVVDVYDPATDTWTTAADFPTPRYDPTAAVVDGKIYAIGGKVGELDDLPVRQPVSTVEEFDPGLPGVMPSVSPAGKLLETWGGVKSQ
jgi:N-acetylneuraminic acid mutarotase